ncbi:MAG: PAS domain-containing protein [Alphaproteobacteria bacterium]|nr:PAS domain-containing protein [Alphaproteobacteria bacterium]
MTATLIALLDGLPDPVLLVDSRRTLVAVNRAARALFIGPMVGNDLAVALRHPAALAAVDAVLGGADVREAEIGLPAPGSPSYQLIVAAVGGDDRPGAVVTLRDLTAIRNTERMRADFIANVSHELRSPLAALLGFIETLKGPARDDVAAREKFLDIMHVEASRMARLIDDLLSLSRVELEEHVPPRETVDLGVVIEGTFELLAMRAAERNVTLRLEGAESAPKVLGDSDQLFQVFRNLVENAIRYGRADSTVTVTLQAVARIPERSGPGVAATVIDQGEGIPPDALPRLTERFYRVDKARSKTLGSTGLGLAIVKHIVGRHRGRLTIDSRIGHGSRFTVFLPVAS